MTSWKYDWTLTIEVDDRIIETKDYEDIIEAIREKLDDLHSYAKLIGIQIEKKAIHDTNPDMQQQSLL